MPARSARPRRFAPHALAFWRETRRPSGGRGSPAQFEFEGACDVCRVPYGRGDPQALADFLIARGVCTRDVHGILDARAYHPHPCLTMDDTTKPMLAQPPEHILQFFAYAHPPTHPQLVSRPFFNLAHAIVYGDNVEESGTVTVGEVLPRSPAAQP